MCNSVYSFSKQQIFFCKSALSVVSELCLCSLKMLSHAWVLFYLKCDNCAAAIRAFSLTLFLLVIINYFRHHIFVLVSY